MGNSIDKVLPGLYVGGFLGELRAAGMIFSVLRTWLFSGTDKKKKLQDNKITHILAIHDNAEPEFPVSRQRGR